jgi:hypothetical protein
VVVHPKYGQNMDIIELLEKYEVPYKTTGNNVSHGNVNIKCPYCGSADPSEHLGIDLTTGKWGCWRNTSHRGRRLPSLLTKLLGCSYEQAVGLTCTRTSRTNLQKVASRLKVTSTKDSQEVPKVTHDLIPGLERLSMHNKFVRFHSYLVHRGYDYHHHSALVSIYNLHAALWGPMNNRLVFVLSDNNGILGYTGRAIDNSKTRYYSIPGPVIKHTVLQFSDLLYKGGRRLYVCEGPFDAMRIDYVARTIKSPDRATCVFGVDVTTNQIECLVKLSVVFDELVIIMDSDAAARTMRLSRELSSCCTAARILPGTKNDPADLPFNEVEQMVLS